MSEDGIRRMRFNPDPNDPDASRKWAASVVDAMEEIYQGPVPALPGGADRHDLVEEVLQSVRSDWEVGAGGGDPAYFSWGARHRLNRQLRMSLIGKRLPEDVAGAVVHLMMTWHRRLVISDTGILVEGDIVVPHPSPKDYYFTEKSEELWRTVHVIQGRADEFDRALATDAAARSLMRTSNRTPGQE